MDSLLFIDTNIYLDFYRVRQDVSKKLINHIEGIAERIIVTYQVDMEFKKHRQKAILGSIGTLKPPSRIPRPVH